MQGFQPVCFKIWQSNRQHQLGKLDAKLMMTFLVSSPPLSLSMFLWRLFNLQISNILTLPSFSNNSNMPSTLTHYLSFPMTTSTTLVTQVGFGEGFKRDFRKWESAQRVLKVPFPPLVASTFSPQTMTCEWYLSHSPDFISATSFSHDNNVHSFVDTSVAIETIATSAYLETLQSFNHKVVGSVVAGFIFMYHHH